MDNSIIWEKTKYFSLNFFLFLIAIHSILEYEYFFYLLDNLHLFSVQKVLFFAD